MKKGEKAKSPKAHEMDLGAVKLGGIFKGLGAFLDLVAELAERGQSEIRREGEFTVPGSKKTKAVYGVSVRVGAEGRPKIEPFGNIRADRVRGPVVDETREPLVDVFDETGEIVVIAEMPGVSESDIQVEPREDILTLSASTGERKYHKEVLLPRPVKPDDFGISYRNGVLELRLKPAASETGPGRAKP